MFASVFDDAVALRMGLSLFDWVVNGLWINIRLDCGDICMVSFLM